MIDTGTQNERQIFERVTREHLHRFDKTYENPHTFKPQQMAGYILDLLVDTALINPLAESYRGFNVSAGAIAWSPLGITGRAFGYNVKHDATDQVNIHAEDVAIKKLQQQNNNLRLHLAWLAIVGPVQTDHKSGLATKTLHPCGRCRILLQGSDCNVVTATPDLHTIQISTIHTLQRLHEGDPSAASNITTIELEAPGSNIRTWRQKASDMLYKNYFLRLARRSHTIQQPWKPSGHLFLLRETQTSIQPKSNWQQQG